MNFSPLEYLKYMIKGGSNNYYHTKKLPPFARLTNNEAEFLNPDTWNAYDTFLTTAQLYAVISRRGHLLASGVWKHYKVDLKGNRELVQNSDVVKLLENPHVLVDGNSHLMQLNENLCVFGNNYEYLNYPFTGADLPASIANLSPTNVSIKTTGKFYKQSKIEDIIKYYEYHLGDSGSDKIDPKEISHHRVINSQDPIKGDSPMRSIYTQISNIRSAMQFRNAIMTKRGMLGIISNDGRDESGGVPLDKTERQRIEDSYKSQYGIGDDQMQTLITNASIKYTPTSYPTKNLLLFEEVDANFRTIIDHYGLNDNIFSREKGSTFTNVSEGIKQAYQSTILPFAEELGLRYSRLFNLLGKGEYVELDYSHITVLQENEKERAEILKLKTEALVKLKEYGSFSDEELRDIVGLK